MCILQITKLRKQGAKDAVKRETASVLAGERELAETANMTMISLFWSPSSSR